MKDTLLHVVNFLARNNKLHRHSLYTSSIIRTTKLAIHCMIFLFCITCVHSLSDDALVMFV